MSSDSYHRKLAAIFYADVVGYSRLSGDDEEGTHSRVMAVLDLANQIIGDSGGTVLRYAGDAILAEFSSAVGSVKAAVLIQNKLAEGRSSTADQEPINIRIGINLGDVIQDRGEVFGDGVNLAARLESAAPSGGICISKNVHDQLQGKADYGFVEGGQEQFKNIDRPVDVFYWTPQQSKTPSSQPNHSGSTKSEMPSIAVLALTNMNRDADLDFIGDGITEDLITALSKIRSFKVISRESTFSYKGTALDIRKIADELGVRYVLEGSVRKGGSRIRVTAQLIDAETGHHVWAEKYDREMEDIFDLQDEMVQIIAAALEPELYAFERERAVRKSPENLDAWEMYQRGLHHMWVYQYDSVLVAIDLFKQANEKDPTFAPAYAYLAYSYYITVILGYAENPDQQLDLGLEAATSALKCDDKDAMSYFAVGRINMMKGDQDSAISFLQKSISLNPCFAQSYHGLGMALALAGRLDESISTTTKAVELSPQDPMIWAFLAVHSLTLILRGENTEARNVALDAMRYPTASGYWCHAVLASALGNLGEIDKAKNALKVAIKEKPGLSLDFIRENLPTKEADGLVPYLNGLIKAGLS